MIKGRDEFILGIAIKEVEAWVLADRDHVIAWLGGSSEKNCPADCRFWQSGYRAEKDPDPKQTLTMLLKSSNSDYDEWGRGAAEDFVEKYWRGTYLSGEFIAMNEWPGRADLRLLAEKCPEGYKPFEEEILRMLGR